MQEITYETNVYDKYMELKKTALASMPEEASQAVAESYIYLLLSR